MSRRRLRRRTIRKEASQILQLMTQALQDELYFHFILQGKSKKAVTVATKLIQLISGVAHHTNVSSMRWCGPRERSGTLSAINACCPMRLGRNGGATSRKVRSWSTSPTPQSSGYSTVVLALCMSKLTNCVFCQHILLFFRISSKIFLYFSFRKFLASIDFC